MNTAPKPRPSPTAHRIRLAISWLLFIAFVTLLGFGIVLFQTQTATHDSGLAMAVVGLIGLAALATSLRVARARALANRGGGGVYAGGSYSGGYVGGMNQHEQWFHQHQMWDQRRRDDEYEQQQNFHLHQQQQQQQWNNNC